MFDRPIFLEPNVMRRPYRGGMRLAAFRGFEIAEGERLPEDWLASTTAVYGHRSEGLTRLSDGRLLRDAIRADPIPVLGPDHVAVFGPDPALLVKLLDAQQRLSIHIHPDRSFARSRLGLRYGKTEAWHVLSADVGAAVHIGFRESIDPLELRDIVERGLGASLLDRMHHLQVAAGDTVFIPAGVPHAIGEGLFLIEAQEPSDLLVRLEWSGYAVAGMTNDLGLGFPVALQAVDCGALTSRRLQTLVRRSAAGKNDLLPGAARGFFQMSRHSGLADTVLEPGYKIVVILRGTGMLQVAGTDHAVRAGDCLMVSWACGSVVIRGEMDLVCCRPAHPADAIAFDADISKFPSQAHSHSRGNGHDAHQHCC